MPDPEPGGEEAPREPRAVAVKILRPGIERAFERDLEFFYWLAEWVERTQPKLRRFRPIEAVRVFEATVRLEMDLRMGGADASERDENVAGRATYTLPGN